MTTDQQLAAGAYARKQIFSRSRLVAWSHRSRFRLAAVLASAAGGESLLDYGCGDGTFVASVQGAFRQTVGTDLDGPQLAECAVRFGGLDRLAFLPLDVLRGDPRHAGAYDVVTCMEVLEHCPEGARAEVLSDLRRLVRRDGRVIISVPIEVGVSLLAKQSARRVAAWRGIGDYRFSERYTARELACMLAAGRGWPIARPVYGGNTAAGQPSYHGHKGFNWRAVEGEIDLLFRIDAVRFTPVPMLRQWLNSQVWWICRPR